MRRRTSWSASTWDLVLARADNGGGSFRDWFARAQASAGITASQRRESIQGLSHIPKDRRAAFGRAWASAGQAMVEIRHGPPPAKTRPSLDDLVAAVADQIAAELFNEVRSGIEIRIREHVARLSIHRPRVLVVGPLVKQQHLLREEFGDLVDLRFVSSEEGTRRVSESAAGVSAIVIWTNFTSHDQETMAKARHTDVRRVSGGLAEIKDELTRLAVEKDHARRLP